ncbi:MAG: lipopolysaccharide heptosyltransferase II [Chloroflexi bacterium]|nr:lipopolysaccharide heptosyltransferase II [Chloroflexota bacterium]
MPQATPFTTAVIRLLRPFIRVAIRRRPITPPRKALILKPCCMSQVLLATPLLRQLEQAYPDAQFDWAVTEWARPAIATNPRVSHIIPTGNVGLPHATWGEIFAFARSLRDQQYDTCFIPSSSSALSLIPWLAGIPQRVGLDVNGRGFAHTLPVRPPAEAHTAEQYLALATALGLDTATARTEFFPSDASRTQMTERLVDEMGWLGDVPLVMMHPGGGTNPAYPDQRKQWPAERFARLGNHLVRQYGAKVLLVGSAEEAPLAASVAGMMSAAVLNLAGKTTLGELGALGEVASLYVGNDAGATHVAAAVGCPVLAIYGPNSPAFSRPYVGRSQGLATAWQAYEEPFTWEKGISTAEVIRLADELLGGGA